MRDPRAMIWPGFRAIGSLLARPYCSQRGTLVAHKSREGLGFTGVFQRLRLIGTLSAGCVIVGSQSAEYSRRPVVAVDEPR
jgi:hypothetical protein